jgi:hypothetical protein
MIFMPVARQASMTALVHPFWRVAALDLGFPVNLLGQTPQPDSLKSSSRGAERHAGNAWASADLNAAENRCTVLHIGHWHFKQICSPLESIINSEI